MVQRRHWRKDYCDGHYAAAIFRYERELAVKFCEVATFACLDDKHRIKVGENGFPVAAAERGRRVKLATTILQNLAWYHTLLWLMTYQAP